MTNLASGASGIGQSFGKRECLRTRGMDPLTAVDRRLEHSVNKNIGLEKFFV
jgi:hypothetical protein